MTIQEYILDCDSSSNNEELRDTLECLMHDGLGYYYPSEYSAFLREHKDECKDYFDDILHIIGNPGDGSGYLESIFNKTTIDDVLDFLENVELSNGPFFTDNILYKDKPLFSKYSYPLSRENLLYPNVAEVMDNLFGVVQATCELAVESTAQNMIEDLDNGIQLKEFKKELDNV